MSRSKKRLKPRRRARFRRIAFRPMTEAQIKKAIDEDLKPRYRVTCYYRGLDKALDAKIQKLARCRSDDSGMNMRLELRDITFHFDEGANLWRKARAAAERIKAADIPGVRVLIYGSWEMS